jgi:hypothetical protein
MTQNGWSIRFSDDGEIVTWGIDLVDAEFFSYADLPSDFDLYSNAKYRYEDGEFVVRDGWVDPLAEEEVPAEPETPADPE